MATHSVWHAVMKTIVRLVFLLIYCFCIGIFAMHPVIAQGKDPNPRISLTVKDQPLGTVLDSIANDTGYQFNLSREWEDHPVSATINDMPLDQGLKRLLRSLNHAIVWEANKTVTIKVYGKAEPGKQGAISFSAPPQTYQEEAQPEPEPGEGGSESVESGTAGQEGGQEEVQSEPQGESPAAEGQPTSPGEAPGLRGAE